MWLGTAAATGVCFIGFVDSADIEKVTHETQKNSKIMGGLFEITIRLKKRKT